MDVGVSMMFTDESATPAEVAVAAEARGLESLFAPEHTHIPTSRATPFPAGGPLPRPYHRSLDPFVALATAAAVTRTLKVGTGVCLVAQRDPLILAKEVATLDRLAQGRFLFGVGAGWNREEMANHGTDPRTRWDLLAERVAALRVLWADEEAEFHGRFVDFDPVWSWPKPEQRPGPPVLLGGAGARALAAVVAYADEWSPIYGRPEDFPSAVAELARAAEAAGRPPFPITVFQAPSDPAGLEQLAGLGVHRAVFTLPSAPLDQLLDPLDRIGALAAALGRTP